ncbi:hypothetical protein OAO87_01420 [bacterium]|nr:hypothetical protein [bacterium]
MRMHVIHMEPVHIRSHGHACTRIRTHATHISTHAHTYAHIPCACKAHTSVGASASSKKSLPGTRIQPRGDSASDASTDEDEDDYDDEDVEGEPH